MAEEVELAETEAEEKSATDAVVADASRNQSSPNRSKFCLTRNRRRKSPNTSCGRIAPSAGPALRQ